MNLPDDFNERLEFFKNTLGFNVVESYTFKELGDICIRFSEGVFVTVKPYHSTMSDVVDRAVQAGYEQGYDEGCYQQGGS